MNTGFRVAIIGCGAISGNHIESILAAGQTICALCDIQEEKARTAITKYALNSVPVYTDYLSMLDTEKPDTVHICTPHYLHAEMAIAALERNIHVLCEKPVCISIPQLDALHTAVRASKAQLGICFQNRYEPNMQRLFEMTRTGVRGGCAHVVWKRDADYYHSADWRGTWKQEGGGVMINQAIHTLDLLQWICGTPTHVIAHTANDCLREVIEVEDTAYARFQKADGSTFHFFATTSSQTDLPIQLEIRLASGETVLASKKWLVSDKDLYSQQHSADPIGKTAWGSCHKALIADFYNCLTAQCPFPIDLEQGERAVRMILAMYRSNGESVSIFE